MYALDNLNLRVAGMKALWKCSLTIISVYRKVLVFWLIQICFIKTTKLRNLITPCLHGRDQRDTT